MATAEDPTFGIQRMADELRNDLAGAKQLSNNLANNMMLAIEKMEEKDAAINRVLAACDAAEQQFRTSVHIKAIRDALGPQQEDLL